MLACEPASFWREKVVAVVTTSFSANVVMAKTRYQLLEVFNYHSAIGRASNLDLSLKITVLTFPVKNGKMKLSEKYIF